MPHIFLHIVFWLAYLFLQAYITAELGNPSYREFSFWFRLKVGIAEELFLLPIKIGVTYLIFYYFIPQFHSKIWQWEWIIKGLLVFIVAPIIARFSIKYLIFPLVYEQEMQRQWFTFSLWVWTAIDIYSIIGIATAIKLVRLRQQQKLREQQLIQEKLESELNFLRAQTNPHFLFNTLNNIYGLARKQAPETANSVLKLSQLMRFMLYECTSETIPLEEEVAIIEDYIELEKLRYNQRLKVQFAKDIDQPKQSIAPLLLLPFVENAFKHGASESRFEVNILINLSLKNGVLQFKVVNTKDSIKNALELGIGLKNVKRQLELIYGDKHQLEIEDKRDYFEINVRIVLS